MYKTALGAAPFNTETTREVGGGRGAGHHGSNSPAQEIPRTAEKPRWGWGWETKPTAYVWSRSRLVKVSVQRPCLSGDWRGVLSPDSNHQGDSSGGPLGGLSPGRVLASQEPKFPQLHVGHGGKAATGVMQF